MGIEKSHKKTGECCLCSSPPTYEWRQCWGKELQEQIQRLMLWRESAGNR